jgi:hypothetical protein
MKGLRDRKLSKVGLTFSLVVFLVMIALPASAEVMDKEMAPVDISKALALSVLLAVPTAAVHRWLLLPLFAFGPAQGLACAWTEWHDPFVGPAILREAGASYGLFADGAMAVAVAAYVGLWLASRRLRHGARVLVVTAIRFGRAHAD